MDTTKITLFDYEDAAEFLITTESLIKAARSLYVQLLHNEMPVDADTRLMLLGELEERGLLLAKMKMVVLHALDLRAMPITIDAL